MNTSIRSSSGRALGSVILLVGVGLAMAWFTWLTWADVLIDFGRELYVAWQLAEGRVLYRDVAHHNGPLSAYWNALWFYLLGPGIHKLFAVNAALLGVLTLLLLHLFERVSDRFTATVACALFLALFGFGQLTTIANYNYLAPYSHEVTHGLLLGLAGLGAAYRYAATGRIRHAAAAGLLLGLVALTKPELTVPALVSTPLVIGLAHGTDRQGVRCAARGLGVAAAAALLPVVLALGLLGAAMPIDEAALWIFRGWLLGPTENVLSIFFYLRRTGIHDVGGGLRSIVSWGALEVACFLPAVLLALRLRSREPGRRWIVATFFAASVALLLVVLQSNIGWERIFLPLPVAMVVLFLVFVGGWWRVRTQPTRRTKALLRLALVLYATTLLLKIFLNASINHYGFVMGMPAALLCFTALLGWIPAAIERRGGLGAAFRAYASGALLIVVVGHLGIMHHWAARKTVVLGSGSDRVLSPPGVGLALNEGLEALERHLAKHETLGVVPQGAVLNYLLRRPASNPYFRFDGLSLAFYGEERMTEAWRRSPPDVIAEVTFREGRFGKTYAVGLGAWIEANYHELPESRARFRGQERRFGVRIFRRREASGPGAAVSDPERSHRGWRGRDTTRGVW